jgi:hypothetical protein
MPQALASKRAWLSPESEFLFTSMAELLLAVKGLDGVVLSRADVGAGASASRRSVDVDARVRPGMRHIVMAEVDW